MSEIPDELVEALRDAAKNQRIRHSSRIEMAALALLDAAERPDDEHNHVPGQPTPDCPACEKTSPEDGVYAPETRQEAFDTRSVEPPASVGEPLCRCGHAKERHSASRMVGCLDCTMHLYEATPAPVPVSDEAEAWDTGVQVPEAEAAYWTWFHSLPEGTPFNAFDGFLAGFRAARGEEA